MPTVYIDADACPVTREAIAVARERGYSVVLVGNATQNFDRYTRRNGVEAIMVSTGRDSADFVIIENLTAEDVVVTQDIGLAAMVLGRGARAIGVRGRIFSPATIDIEMEVRHAEQVHRRSGGRTQGPSKFEDEDREHFAEQLARLLDERRP